MTNVAVSIRPDSAPVVNPNTMLSGTVTSLRADLAAALGLPVRDESNPQSRGVRTISAAESAEKNGLVGTLIVESFVLSALAQIGCSAEILAGVNAQLQSYGRIRGSLPLAAALFENTAKDGHRYVSIKCSAFVGAQQQQ